MSGNSAVNEWSWLADQRMAEVKRQSFHIWGVFLLMTLGS